MRRALRTAFRAYSALAALVLTLAAGGLAGGLALKKVTPHGLRAAGEALLAGGEAGEAARPAPPREDRGGSRPKAPPAPAAGADLLGEIERASEDLRAWEGRIDLLALDLNKRLTDADVKARTIQDEEVAWNRI